MKKLLLAILLLISLTSFSQARVGYSYREIKNEFVKFGITKCESLEEDNLYFNDDNIRVYYTFTNNICNKTVIMTDQLLTALEIISLYDKTFYSIPQHYNIHENCQYNWRFRDNKRVNKINYTKDEVNHLFIFTWK